MGASAGGVEAVTSAIAGLPRNLRAAVLVVIHTGAGAHNLASVLGRRASLPVRPARDGAGGLRAIKRAGGRAIVQSPEHAALPSMPLAALREVEVDAVLPVAEIGADVAAWAARNGSSGTSRRAPARKVARVLRGTRAARPRRRRLGRGD
jgi:chemotaxis response regulator CheB